MTNREKRLAAAVVFAFGVLVFGSIEADPKKNWRLISLAKMRRFIRQVWRAL
jgi:hypothetical protein